MAQQANIVAFDGQTTPVSHTFTGMSVSQEAGVHKALWSELISNVASEGHLTFTQERRVMKDGHQRLVSNLSWPVLEAIATGGTAQGYLAAPRRAHVISHSLISHLSPRSTELESQWALMLLANIILNRTTTQPVVNTGFVSDLHLRKLVAS